MTLTKDTKQRYYKNNTFGTFNPSDLLYIFIMIGEMKEAAPIYRKKFVCSDSPGQNIWHKVKKYSQTGQDLKNLISNFAWFLRAFVKV